MIFKGRYYDSIRNCPLSVWNQISETGDVRFLYRGGWYRKKKALQAYQRIQSEYISEFGIPSFYRDYLKEMGRAAWEWSKVWNGEPWRKPVAMIREAQAKGKLDLMPKQSFITSLAQVSKGMGYRIDPKKITVWEFYGYVKALS